MTEGGAGRGGPVLEGPVRGDVDRRSVDHARVLARLLDNAIPIPGTGRRIGLDPLIGLVPGLGDLVGAGVSGYIMLLAAKAGAPKIVIARMLGNVALDSLVGGIPLLGDLFDFAFKANARNMALLDRYVNAPAPTARASGAMLFAIVALVLLLVAGGFAVAFLFARWLVGRLDGSG